MANKFNKRKCQSCIRLSINLPDTKIIVTGQHSYEYTVIVISTYYNKGLTFPNRSEALKEVTRLKKQYSKLGYCRLAI